MASSATAAGPGADSTAAAQHPPQPPPVTAARIVTDRLAETLKQNVVVDNRPGAGSLNGTDLVAKAAPDGYTLLVIAASFTITPAMQSKMPFDPVRDFAPITRTSSWSIPRCLPSRCRNWWRC